MSPMLTCRVVPALLICKFADLIATPPFAFHVHVWGYFLLCHFAVNVISNYSPHFLSVHFIKHSCVYISLPSSPLPPPPPPPPPPPLSRGCDIYCLVLQRSLSVWSGRDRTLCSQTHQLCPMAWSNIRSVRGNTQRGVSKSFDTLKEMEIFFYKVPVWDLAMGSDCW